MVRGCRRPGLPFGRCPDPQSQRAAAWTAPTVSLRARTLNGPSHSVKTIFRWVREWMSKFFETFNTWKVPKKKINVSIKTMHSLMEIQNFRSARPCTCGTNCRHLYTKLTSYFFAFVEFFFFKSLATPRRRRRTRSGGGCCGAAAGWVK